MLAKHLCVCPIHLLKSFRNNWVTEKSQTLKFQFDDVKYEGKWSDVCKVFRREENNMVRRTKLSHQSCYPTNLDMQKVQLFVDVFNEKTVAALHQDGFIDTASLVEKIMILFHILNVKDPKSHLKLRDDTRKPIRNVEDDQLKYLLSMAQAFSKMSGGSGYGRTASLTSQTRNAFSQTLCGLVELTKNLLRDGHHYVMLGVFQSDQLEAEFGFYRLVYLL